MVVFSGKVTVPELVGDVEHDDLVVVLALQVTSGHPVLDVREAVEAL